MPMHNVLWEMLRPCLPSLLVAGGLFGFAYNDLALYVLCLSLALCFGVHQWHFIRLKAWAASPHVDKALEGSGDWDTVFGQLYRHERKLAEKLARRDADIARFEAAVQAIQDGVIMLDEQGSILWCNQTAEQQFGIRYPDDEGQPVFNLVRQPEFVSYLEHADFEHPLVLRGERQKDALLSISVFPYAGHKRLVQIKDVTQADRLERVRRDFVSNVSHELRTPLTVLSGFLETLQTLPLSEEESRESLRLMAEQSVRMENIVQDLLALSGLEAAPPPVDERVDMRSLLDRLSRDAHVLSGGQHEISLSVDGVLELKGAEHELLSAFGNLVSNAVRYTPPGGRVQICWKGQAEGGVFSVQDSGVGIDARHLPRLTERFYRVDRGRSRERGGTGLGLAIVKHVLQRHQAHLEINSTPGQGSIFSARFPSGRVLKMSSPCDCV